VKVAEAIPSDASDALAEVRRYYGRVLGGSGDLKTSACCAGDAAPEHLRALIADVHPEVRERFYGCGLPLPPALSGCTVLDLGCGTGRDCYVLSRLVGEAGRVIGVDMTPEQLAIARRHREWHARAYGYARSNVELLEGYVEDLRALAIPDESVDVVTSNCVVNLSPDKPRVLREIFRVLKPGGELYFSDVFADRRVPPALRQDPVLLGECLAGALYTEDFRRMVADVGCADVRAVATQPITLDDPEIRRRIGMVGFRSLTIRAFKLALEDRCEDYGQVAQYLGTIPELPHAFDLDDHHHFETGRPMLVCGNTADMLARTRYAPHFRVVGDKATHFGLFDCAPAGAASPAAGGPCC
jgi:ubiquinone/menaquinone biosynthesis C-methylase UbiE